MKKPNPKQQFRFNSTLIVTCSLIASLALGMLGWSRPAQAQTNTGLTVWLKFDEAAGSHDVCRCIG